MPKDAFSKEFQALRTVTDALSPLSPESRRKIIEAVHALLQISEGRPPSHGGKGPGAKAAAGRSPASKRSRRR